MIGKAARAWLERTRGRRRGLRFGLATLLGPRPRGFFIPHRHADAVRPCTYPELETRLARRAAAFEEMLAAIERLGPRLRALAGPPPTPRFDQGWFPRLDAAAAYTMVCRERPRRIIEIGSGHSTRFLAGAIADQGLATELTCIDPAPRRSLEGLGVRWQRTIVQEAPESCFTTLAAGDVLFVDSSHVLMPGSDVDWIVNRILPAMKPGVLVHFHDVFLPDAYPASWAWRGYNEQSAIAALIQGEGYEIEFASRFVASRRPERLRRGVLAELPLIEGAFESSLWLRKRG
jgi:predicted O-methyltransferase YrrM